MSAIRKPSPDGRTMTPAFRQGMKMAVQLLKDMEELDGDYLIADRCQLESKYRNGKPFDDLMLRRLHAARQQGQDVEAGFCAVVSHILALNAGGCGVRAGEMVNVTRWAITG